MQHEFFIVTSGFPFLVCLCVFMFYIKPSKFLREQLLKLGILKYKWNNIPFTWRSFCNVCMHAICLLELLCSVLLRKLLIITIGGIYSSLLNLTISRLLKINWITLWMSIVFPQLLFRVECRSRVLRN